jgi:hypothetical protein
MAGKIIIFFSQDMFYKTFIKKMMFSLVYLLLNNITISFKFLPYHFAALR